MPDPPPRLPGAAVLCELDSKKDLSMKVAAQEGAVRLSAKEYEERCRFDGSSRQ